MYPICKMGLFVSSHFTSHHLGTCLENRGVTSNFAPTLKLKCSSHSAGLFCGPSLPLTASFESLRLTLVIGLPSDFHQTTEAIFQSIISVHIRNPIGQDGCTRHAGLVKAKLKNGFQCHLRLKFQEKLWRQWPKTKQRASLSVEPECKCASTC